MARLALFLTLLLAPAASVAQVTVRATLEPPRVSAGESVELAVEVKGAQDAPAPAIEGTGGLNIRYVGPSTEVQIINGQVAASVTHRFSVATTTPGAFTIGPITVDYRGQRLSAGSVALQVTAGAAGGGGPGTGQLRLTLSVDRTELYLHERVPLGVRLSVGATRVGDLQYPVVTSDGLALEQFPQPSQHREQTAQGMVDVVDFRTVLTPLRAGTLTVGPATMRLSLLERSRRNDPFFGSFMGENRRPIDLTSEPVTLTVLPLPDADRPPEFTGAVGQFTLDVRQAPLALNVGDPVTVTSTIRGDGWLEGVAPPAIAASEALRVYPPQPAAPPGGQAPPPGTKVFEQVVIPQRPGTVMLPELRFSYFDPGARTYRTMVHPATPLTVTGSAATAEPRIIGNVPARERPETLGRDLVFIKDAPGRLRPLGARLWRSPAFWLWQLVPLAAWLAAIVVDRRRRRLSGDVRFARFTRAGRAARQAIAGARTALAAGNHAAFYDTVARAVSEYLSAKLDLPPGSVTPDAVGERLRGHGLPQAVTSDVEEFFAACERARFAPSADANSDMERTLARADAIVRGLERERRLGRALAAATLLLVLAQIGRALAATETPNTIFFQGNTLYGEERYPEAAAAYERVLAGGHESGHLHFNLGNAYLKSGDVGRAVLAYERAARFMPADPDLRANLEFARTLSGDMADEPLWRRALLPLASRLGTEQLLLAATLCYSGLLFFLALARLLPALQRAVVPTAVALGIALLFLLPAAIYRLAAVDGPTMAVVVAAEEASVRFEPSASGTVHFPAKPGSVLRVLVEREGWAQVARRDGRRGWIARDAITNI